MGKKTKIIPDEKTIGGLVEEYSKLTAQEKLIKERKSELSTIIKDYAKSSGTKDDKGSFYCSNESFNFGAQCKKSVSLNEDKAINLIKTKGYEDCLKTIIKVDEEALERRLSTGDITQAEIESISDVKVTYAVDVKAKNTEELPEVQKSEVIAASAKRKPLLKRKK